MQVFEAVEKLMKQPIDTSMVVGREFIATKRSDTQVLIFYSEGGTDTWDLRTDLLVNQRPIFLVSRTYTNILSIFFEGGECTIDIGRIREDHNEVGIYKYTPICVDESAGPPELTWERAFQHLMAMYVYYIQQSMFALGWKKQ